MKFSVTFEEEDGKTLVSFQFPEGQDPDAFRDSQLFTVLGVLIDHLGIGDAIVDAMEKDK